MRTIVVCEGYAFMAKSGGGGSYDVTAENSALGKGLAVDAS